MMPSPKLHFNQYRDTGQIFNSTFTFIKQNFGVLFKLITTISIPPILLAGALIIFGIYTLVENVKTSSLSFLYSFIYFAFAGLILVIGAILFIACIFEFIAIYKDSDDYTKISTGQVWKQIRKNFMAWVGKIILWSIISATLSSVISSILFVLVIPATFLSVFSQSMVLYFIFIIAFYALTFLISAYVQSIGIPIFYLTAHDKKDLIPSIGKAFQLMHSKGNFWKGIFATLLGNLVQYILTYSFMVPGSILFAVVAFNYKESGASFDEITESSSILIVITVFAVLYYIALLYSTVIYFVSQSFKTGDLNERAFGTNLLARINEIGTKRNLDVDFQKETY